MRYRLLVDLDAISVLDGMSGGVRKRFLAHFDKLRAAPEQHSDYQEYDQEDRLVEVNVLTGWSIHYWIDAADRHVKILAIQSADK